ncbi:MAG: translation initiation factor IF-3 [Spirochaetae bacterium HGW-Spirochaetae-5]|nr:MAG: translation initiation factor IF-3 [Spirochaetae bacterium HGW-Spirochaetae-5]
MNFLLILIALFSHPDGKDIFRGYDTNKDKFDKFRINEEIIAENVRLVGEEGEPVVIALSAALAIAREKSLDLVEITANQELPVVRIIDYSKFKFDQIKKAKEAKKKQKIVHIKEIKMRPAIDDNDFTHKVNRAKDFLEKGDKVKFTLMFRGREMVHPELGFEVMEKVQEVLKDIGTIEKRPIQEGRNITMYMTPVSK